MSKIKLGIAITGSFCTFDKVLNAIDMLEDYEITAIVSENTKNLDTRFYKASDFLEKLRSKTARNIIDSIPKAEPIGPNSMFDVLLVAPCTGNTLGKLANGICDNTVTMAVKSHLRNKKPVLLAVSTNDGLSTSLINIATLINKKHMYFVPFLQDDCIKKPNSLVADFSLLDSSIKEALNNNQLQPILA